jgi:hypothetical protein
LSLSVLMRSRRLPLRPSSFVDHDATGDAATSDPSPPTRSRTHAPHHIYLSSLRVDAKSKRSWCCRASVIPLDVGVLGDGALRTMAPSPQSRVLAPHARRGRWAGDETAPGQAPATGLRHTFACRAAARAPSVSLTSGVPFGLAAGRAVQCQPLKVGPKSDSYRTLVRGEPLGFMRFSRRVVRLGRLHRPA